MSRSVVMLSARGVDRLRAGHPWVYRSDIRSSDAEPGDLVRVESERGRPLGTGFWSSTSQIALRFLGQRRRRRRARDARATACGAALAFRDTLGDRRAPPGAPSTREADRLPGLIVDVYGEGARPRRGGPDADAGDGPAAAGGQRRPGGAAVARAASWPATTRKVRRLEGLPEEVPCACGDVPEAIERARRADSSTRSTCAHGQKTGLFLDQRENHATAAGTRAGRGLDAFAYHGGFALRLAARCDDGDWRSIRRRRPSRRSRRTRARNGLTNVDAREVNVFDELRELEIARERFDTIVLDPPAFAKNKASVPRAAAGYKEINLRALKLLTPGGHLITCSCSYNVDEALFHEILEQAAADARATVSLVEKRAQARDHPVLLNVPETHYLKCFVLRKLA